MTIKNPIGEAENIRGRILEPGAQINPADGLVTVAETLLVAFNVADVASIAGVKQIVITNAFDDQGKPLASEEKVTDENGELVYLTEDLEEEKYEGWTVELITPGGESKSGRLEKPMHNKTLGYVSGHVIKKL
jgi:hypothetical protein